MAVHGHVEGVNQWAFLWPRCSCSLYISSVECQRQSCTSAPYEGLVERAELYGFTYS